MHYLPKALSRPLIAAALAATAAPALACSPAPGYRIPTNLELANQANLILVADVVGRPEGAADDLESAGILIRPVETLKGLTPTSDIRLPGMMLQSAGHRSEPLEFRDAHPDAYTGACIRRSFAQGSRVLFFLSRENGEWAPAGGPFSRWAEDVPDDAAPWSQLALLYAHASLLPADERAAMLEDQLDALEARAAEVDDPVARAMAEDVARQMAGPNPPLVPALPPAPEAEAPTHLGEVEAVIDAMGADQPQP